MRATSSNGGIVNKWRRCKCINEILKGNEKERTAAASKSARRELEKKGERKEQGGEGP